MMMTTTDYNEKLISISARLKQLNSLMETLADQKTLLLREFDQAKEEYETTKE